MKKPISVCFVCLGNICRSPTAEAVFRKLALDAGEGERFFVDSAGTAGYHIGKKADARSRAHGAKRGYDLTSIARQVTREDFSRFDYVLAMDAENLENLRALRGNSNDGAIIELFRAFDPESPKGASVPDPYYGGEVGFEEVLDICERASRGLLEHLRTV